MIFKQPPWLLLCWTQKGALFITVIVVSGHLATACMELDSDNGLIKHNCYPSKLPLESGSVFYKKLIKEPSINRFSRECNGNFFVIQFQFNFLFQCWGPLNWGYYFNYHIIKCNVVRCVLHGDNWIAQQVYPTKQEEFTSSCSADNLCLCLRWSRDDSNKVLRKLVSLENMCGGLTRA